MEDIYIGNKNMVRFRDLLLNNSLARNKFLSAFIKYHEETEFTKSGSEISGPFDFFLIPIPEIPEKTNWQKIAVAESLDITQLDYLKTSLSSEDNKEYVRALENIWDLGLNEEQILSIFEPLVELNIYNEDSKKVDKYHSKIFVEPIYKNQGIKNTLGVVSVRKSIAERLIEATKLLPKGYGILVYDGYRPHEVQQAIFDDFYEQIKSNNPINPKKEEETEEQWEQRVKKYEEFLKAETKKYASIPSTDPNVPSTHSTGGAIDFCICDENGKPLNYGGKFDDITSVSNTIFLEEEFEKSERIMTDDELEGLANRRFLNHLATYVGLVPFKYEWWHFNDPNSQWGLDFDKKEDIYSKGSLYSDYEFSKDFIKTITLEDMITSEKEKFADQQQYLINQNIKIENKNTEQEK